MLHINFIHTSFAVSTSAFHSSLGKKPFKKSALNSASRISTLTSLNCSGKLFVLQFFAWQARTLCVIRRTMMAVEKKKENYLPERVMMLVQLIAIIDYHFWTAFLQPHPSSCVLHLLLYRKKSSCIAH